MPAKTRSPFAGKPYTTVKNGPDGPEEIIVTLAALTPVRKRAVDALRWGGGAAAGAFTLYTVSEVSYPPDWAWALPVPAFGLGAVGTHFSLGELFKKQRRVRFTPDTFSIETLLGWKSFDRQLPHSFTIIEHDKAKREQQRHELARQKAQAKGSAVGKRPYYGESFHLCFEYLGQRNDILTIHGRKTAQQFLARLKAIDEVLDGNRFGRHGTSLRPDDEWSPQPGGLPGAS